MLPPPVETNDERFTAGLSPQEITDRRVDASQPNQPGGQDRERLLALAQNKLDQQTMTREGQQSEADEMDEMGVPEMSRRLGGRTPPNIGRAGSTDVDEEDISAMDEGAYPYEDLTGFQDFNYRATRDPKTGELFNPFPKSTMKSLDSAWVLLKNEVRRGQELMLPPPREPSEFPGTSLPTGLPTAGLSPQEMTDRRVDASNKHANLEFEHELSLRDLAGPNALGVTENYLPMASEQELREKLLNAGILANAPYDSYYGSGDYQSELRDRMSSAEQQERAYEHAQRRLDQQTMTRMGQQGEADEMDAMGVPDMGRSVGGRAPPNVGRAGNSQMTFPSHSLTAEEIEGGLDDLTPPNPFSQRTMKSLDAAWSHLRKALY